MFGRWRKPKVTDADRARAEFWAKLRPEPEPEPPRFELARTLAAICRRALWRGRRILSPVAVLAVLCLAGGVVAARDLPAPAVALTCAAAGAAWWRLRAPGGYRRYTATCLLAAAGWLTVAAAHAPAWSVLAAGWVGLSVPWWRRHWPRPYVEMPDVDPLGDVIVRRWDAHVAPHVHPLMGTHLSDPVPFLHGMEYRVQVIPGRQTVSAALGALEHVASGLLTPSTLIVFEPHPDYIDTDPTQGRLRVLDTSPVKDTVLYDQPRVRDGKVVLGPIIDGMDDALWRIYAENSMYGGLVLGGTGTGKSRTLEGIALGARHMTTLGAPTLVVYVDGQSGASSSLLWRHASLRAGPQEAPDLLAALERLMVARQKWNVAYGLDGFTAGVVPAGAPHNLVGVLVVVDECHRIYSNQPARWATIAREGRKVGVAMIGASQVNDLSAYGNNDALRSSLLAGNGMAFRTPTVDAKNLITGLLVDPATLPPIPGYGYKIAPPGSGERTAPFRARYLPKDADKAKDPTITVASAEDWFTRTPDAELDPLSSRAIGDLYARRHEIAEQQRAAMLAEIEGREPETVGERAVVVPSSPARPDSTREVIERHLIAGATSRADLAQHVLDTIGTGPDAVTKALQGLLSDGVVERTGRGVYRLVGAERVGS